MRFVPRGQGAGRDTMVPSSNDLGRRKCGYHGTEHHMAGYEVSENVLSHKKLSTTEDQREPFHLPLAYFRETKGLLERGLDFFFRMRLLTNCYSQLRQRRMLWGIQPGKLEPQEKLSRQFLVLAHVYRTRQTITPRGVPKSSLIYPCPARVLPTASDCPRPKTIVLQ